MLNVKCFRFLIRFAYIDDSLIRYRGGCQRWCRRTHYRTICRRRLLIEAAYSGGVMTQRHKLNAGDFVKITVNSTAISANTDHRRRRHCHRCELTHRKHACNKNEIDGGVVGGADAFFAAAIVGSGEPKHAHKCVSIMKLRIGAL